MQDFSSVNIKNMIIHNVGNKVKGESLEISTEICDANNEVTNQYLKQFFFSTFKFDVTYRFVHETDIAMNEIYNYVKHIFENPSEFYEQSVNIENTDKGDEHMNTPVDENELLSIEQLCDRLFISATTAYKLLQSGEIKAFKVGTWKIPVKSVNDYIKRKCAD